MLHRSPGGDPFEQQLQLSQLRNVVVLARGRDDAGRELRRPRERRSAMFDAIFTPQPLLDELCDRAWLQAMLDAERALAAAEAESA